MAIFFHIGFIRPSPYTLYPLVLSHPHIPIYKEDKKVLINKSSKWIKKVSALAMTCEEGGREVGSRVRSGGNERGRKGGNTISSEGMQRRRVVGTRQTGREEVVIEAEARERGGVESGVERQRKGRME